MERGRTERLSGGPLATVVAAEVSREFGVYAVYVAAGERWEFAGGAETVEEGFATARRFWREYAEGFGRAAWEEAA